MAETLLSDFVTLPVKSVPFWNSMSDGEDLLNTPLFYRVFKKIICHLNLALTGKCMQLNVRCDECDYLIFVLK